MAFITGTLNNLFGSNVTHVANAYSGSEFVWLVFQCEELTIEEIVLSVTNLSTGGGSGSFKIGTRQISEIIRLPFKHVYKKTRDTRIEFLTVIPSNSKEILCGNMKIQADSSFVITNQGFVTEQEFGSNVWVDHQGIDHYPE